MCKVTQFFNSKKVGGDAVDDVFFCSIIYGILQNWWRGRYISTIFEIILIFFITLYFN